jgi:plastocyanin
MPALVAACGGGDDEDLPAVDGETSPRLEVSATEMAYDPDEVAVAAGTVEIVMHNDGTILHDLRIADQPFIVEAGAGQTGTAQVALEEGSYEYYCSLPGHREAGMEGVLEVR